MPNFSKIAEEMFDKYSGPVHMSLANEYFILNEFNSRLRYEPEHHSIELLTALKKIAKTKDPHNPEEKHIFSIIKIGDEALKDFQSWGCQIARYPEIEMGTLSGRYTKGKPIDIEKEIEFGKKSFQDAEKALKIYQGEINSLPKKLQKEIKNDLKNNPLAFLKETLPEDSAAIGAPLYVILGYLMQRHYHVAKERGSNSQTRDAMRSARSSDFTCTTPLRGYWWAKDLVREIHWIAEDNSRRQVDTLESELDTLSERDGYCLFYKDHIVSQYHVEPNPAHDQWKHGIIDLKTLWPEMEKLHAEVMDFDLDINDINSLKEFYDKVVETIWLMGNLTPALRGTGKLVEQWLTMVHLQHGLRTPILRLENPQIDVLDISLPLAVYKNIFFKLFETDSLPGPIQAELANQQTSKPYNLVALIDETVQTMNKTKAAGFNPSMHHRETKSDFAEDKQFEPSPTSNQVSQSSSAFFTPKAETKQPMPTTQRSLKPGESGVK